MMNDKLLPTPDSLLPVLKVIIINYKRKDMLKNCLESVLNKKTDFSFKVEVIDNASGDGGIRFVKENYPDVTVIENQTNLGFAKAANISLKNGDYRYYLVLNNDTKLDNTCLQNFVDFMNENSDCGAVGPLFLNYDDNDKTVQFENSGYRFLSYQRFIKHVLLEPVNRKNSATAYYQMADVDKTKRQEVDWVNGAAMCIRKEALEQAGYFDENYFMFVEDMDLCYRIKQTKKWKVYLVPDIKVRHYVGKNRINSKWFTNNILHIKSLYYFFRKIKSVK